MLHTIDTGTGHMLYNTNTTSLLTPAEQRKQPVYKCTQPCAPTPRHYYTIAKLGCCLQNQSEVIAPVCGFLFGKSALFELADSCSARWTVAIATLLGLRVCVQIIICPSFPTILLILSADPVKARTELTLVHLTIQNLRCVIQLTAKLYNHFSCPKAWKSIHLISRSAISSAFADYFLPCWHWQSPLYSVLSCSAIGEELRG